MDAQSNEIPNFDRLFKTDSKNSEEVLRLANMFRLQNIVTNEANLARARIRDHESHNIIRKSKEGNHEKTCISSILTGILHRNPIRARE